MLQPVFQRLLVKQKGVESVGGILIPQTAQGLTVHMGEVIAVGGECDTVKVGDVVMYGKYSSTRLEAETLGYMGYDVKAAYGLEDRENIFLMNEEDVLLILPPVKAQKE